MAQETENTENMDEPEIRSSMDELLNRNGVWGFTQVFVHLSMFYVQFSSTGHFVLNFFISHNPAWKCSANSSTNFCLDHRNQTFGSDSDLFSKRCSFNRSQWTYTAEKTFSFVTEFDLVCGKTSTAALTRAFYHMGCLLGSLCSGITSDTYGRKSVMAVSAVTLPFITFGSGFINQVWQLCVLNVLRGVASTGVIYTGYVYLTEFAPPRVRPLSTNVLIFCQQLSYLLVDALAFWTGHWRKLLMYMGLAVLPLWVSFFFLPESPRWLLSKGRTREANAIMAKMRCNGKKKEMILVTGGPLSNKNNHSYLDLMRLPQLRKLTLCLVVLWFVLPVLYYSIADHSMNYGGNMYVDFALSTAADLPSLFSATFLMRTIDRKKVNVGGSLVTSVLIATMLFVPNSAEYRHAVLIAITMAAKLTVSTTFAGLYLWTSELYPTVVRSQGLSICVIAEKLGMVTVPFVTTLLQAVSQDLPLILISVSGLFAAFAGVWLPETLDKPTRETIEDSSRNGRKSSNVLSVDNEAVNTDDDS